MSYQNYPLKQARGLFEALFLPTVTLKHDDQATTLTRELNLDPPTPESIVKCLKLLKQTIGHLYVIHKGPNWIENKVEEMLEEELAYISYNDSVTNETMAFMSIILTEDDDELLIYLYEVHVNPIYQGQKFGNILMSSLHQLAGCLRQGEISIDDVDCSTVIGTKLTVFPDNPKAIDWYTKMGYKFSEDSPRDRKLRSGKVIKPDYYILERRL